MVRDEVLRVHPWNFAVKRESLAAETDTVTWGSVTLNAFLLPNDNLRLLELLDSERFEWQLEQNKILSTESVLYIRYIFRSKDPNNYDSQFINAVSTRMAIELCEPLTQSNTKKRMLLAELADNIRRAQRADGFENPPATFVEDDWINARY